MPTPALSITVSSLMVPSLSRADLSASSRRIRSISALAFSPSFVLALEPFVEPFPLPVFLQLLEREQDAYGDLRAMGEG
jgi:hypothetical protein